MIMPKWTCPVTIHGRSGSHRVVIDFPSWDETEQGQLLKAAPALLAALRDLRDASTDAYKAGRIPAEPFVRAGNVIAKATEESVSPLGLFATNRPQEDTGS